MDPMIDKDLHLRTLSIIGQAYVSAHFDGLFPLLAEDCVWESQWRPDPERGREQVIRYFRNKEDAMGGYSTIRFTVVELVDCMKLNPGRDGAGNRVFVGLYYPEGKLCGYLEQTLNGQVNGALLDLTMNEAGLIARIDLCMPELFCFKPYQA